MDANRFDAMTRALPEAPSRRDALRLVAGSAQGALAGRLNLSASDAKKKKKKKKKKIELCHEGQTISVSKKAKKGHLKHGDTLGPCPVTPCVPQDPVALCAGGCGTRTDNCGQTVVCATCPASQTCLLNGTCATTCPPESNCPEGCACGYATTENLATHCLHSSVITSCEQMPQVCTSTAECPQGQACVFTNCGIGAFDAPRCAPICPCASCPAGQTCLSGGTCGAV